MRKGFGSIVLLLAAAPAFAGADGAMATLFEHGAYRRAAAAAEQRIAADPADGAALAVLARVRAQEGRFDDAEALGERAVKAAPGSADAHYALAEASGQQARAGGILKGIGPARTLKREAEAALAIDPAHPEALGLLIQFHRFAPGIIGGDRKKVDPLIARLLAADPVRGWFMRAQVALRDKDSTRADMCWRMALETGPHDARAAVALASWLASTRRDLPGAERLAAQATVQEPWRTGGWQVLAGVQAHARHWAELDSTLARSEAATDGRLDAWFIAARTLLEERAEPERAERWLRRYLEREPEIGAAPPAMARWRLAQALELQSRKPEAIAELEAALRLDPRLDAAKKDLRRLKG